MKIRDLTYSIKKQALAILCLLQDGEYAPSHWRDDEWFDAIHCDTSVWYNGREVGICLSVHHFARADKSLVITFGEYRNTDGIFVDHWVQRIGMNPPTIKDFTEDAYQSRKGFSYGDILGAHNYILDLIVDHMDQLKSEVDAKKVNDLS